MSETWEINAPGGGAEHPWPLLAEFASRVHADQWLLVGGLMVHLHAARAGIAVHRPTSDIDVVVQVGAGAASYGSVRAEVEQMGFYFEKPCGDGGAHMYLRGSDRIDLMVADRMHGNQVPKVHGHHVFQVPAGTSALNKAVYCRVAFTSTPTVTIRMPNALGALALKGAAFRSDNRDRERHLEDAALLACTVDDSRELSRQLAGSDRGRVAVLRYALDPGHPAWRPYADLRDRGLRALNILSS